MNRLFSLLVILLLAWCSSAQAVDRIPSLPEPIEFKALAAPKRFTATVLNVIDGDTFDVRTSSGTERIRLHLADCPEIAHNSKETDQPFGQAAREWTAKRILGKRVTLEQHGISYQRPVCDVLIDNKSLARGLVRAGLAEVDTDYGKDKTLLADQEYASNKGLKIWSGPHVSPWLWRKRDRSEAPAAPFKAFAAGPGETRMDDKHLVVSQAEPYLINSTTSFNAANLTGTVANARLDSDLQIYATITPSANVQSLLGAADYAAMRTQFGLVIGTNVQAFSSVLSTWAGITPGTGVGTALQSNINSGGGVLTASGAWTASNGTAGFATALATGRTFSVSTDATGTSSAFDGTGNATIPLTLATVNSNVGSFGSATATPTFTVDAKGRLTAAGSTTVTPAVGSITGFGTGVGAALAVNVGSAGAPVLFNGAGGTPSSLTGTNITGIPNAGLLNSKITLGATDFTLGTTTTAANTRAAIQAAPYGNVLVYHKGTVAPDSYPASADTDAARWTALNTAFGAATAATDTVVIGPGTYDGSTSQLTAQCGTIIGQGATLTSAIASDATQATLKLTGTVTEIRGLRVINSSSNASGSTAVVMTPGASGGIYTHRDCYYSGGADALYDTGSNQLTVLLDHVDLDSRWDLYNSQNSNASNVYRIIGGTWHSTSTIAGHAYGFVDRASGQVSEVVGTNITIDTGSSDSGTIGISIVGTGTVRGCKISTPATAVDLAQFGTLVVHPDVIGSGTNGKPTASGTPTYRNTQVASVNGLTVTPSTGTFTIANGKTLTNSNTLTLTATDGSTLAIGAGGTLGTAAYTASSAYEVPLTFSTGVTRTTNTITVNQAFTPSWTGLHTFAHNGIAATPTDAILSTNTTAATNGAQVQMPGDVRWHGSAWKTSVVTASRTIEAYERLTPQNGSNPSGQFSIGFNINAGGDTDALTLTNAGNLSITGSLVTGGSVTANSVIPILTSLSVDVANGVLYATGGNQSVDWGNRTLNDTTGTTVAMSWTTSGISLPSGKTIELGHANDTTLSRASAGQLAIEGVNVLMNGGALGTPSSGTGTNITGIPAANISAGALANGMTGTTQTAGDNSTKLATTAYVDRVSAGRSVRVQSNVTAVPNSGSSPTDAMSYTIPGTGTTGNLAANGDELIIVAEFDSSNSSEPKFYFNGSDISLLAGDQAALAMSVPFVVEIHIKRLTSSSVYITGKYAMQAAADDNTNAVGVIFIPQTKTGLTLTSTIATKFTITGVSTNDITQRTQTVDYISAP